MVDDLSTGHRDAVPAGATFVPAGCTTSPPRWCGRISTRCCTSPPSSPPARAWRAPEKYWENNVLGSLRLLDAVRAAGVPRFVFSSTANIYGNPAELPITETAVAAPPNPYATSKLAVEYALTGDADGARPRRGQPALLQRRRGADPTRRARAASGTTRRPT